MSLTRTTAFSRPVSYRKAGATLSESFFFLKELVFECRL